MPRKGTDTPSTGVAVSRSTGVVRLPGEDDPLTVDITISEALVTMVAGDLEIGSWMPDEVVIRRVDPFSFAFTAEGDRLVFVPDDARAFARHPLVASGAPSTETARQDKWRVKGRRRKKPRVETTPKPQRSISIPKPTMPKLKRSAPAAASAPVAKPAPKPTPKTTPKAEPKAPRSLTGGEETRRYALWIKAIDTARENGWLGLNRVPVHLEQRGRPHDHTYEHGAAANSGPSAHICTICGNFRYRTD